MWRLFTAGSGAFAGALVGLVVTLIVAGPICWLIGVSSFDSSEPFFVMDVAMFLTLAGFAIGGIFGAINGGEPKQPTRRLRDKIKNDDDVTKVE